MKTYEIGKKVKTSGRNVFFFGDSTEVKNIETPDFFQRSFGENSEGGAPFNISNKYTVSGGF